MSKMDWFAGFDKLAFPANIAQANASEDQCESAGKGRDGQVEIVSANCKLCK